MSERIRDENDIDQEEIRELRDRLESLDGGELRSRLMDLAEKSAEGRRLLRLWLVDDAEALETDLDAFRERVEAVFETEMGPAGRMSQGDHAKAKDFRRFVREIRELFHAGFPELARERARIVKDVLEENEHHLNPHRG
ncbi:MAG: hypothetical protein ABEL76_17175 [Bradymonadaceae bacterium]